MLKFEKVSVTLGGKEILKDISFEVRPHTLTCIIGKNGSGKSTLLSALSGTVKYTGKISFCEKNLALMSLKERARLLSMLSQSLPSVGITAEELIKMGRNPYLGIGNKFSAEDEEAVEKAVDIMKIKELTDKRVDRISGGERQKVYLAMTLAQQTRVIALDEPATYLDTEYSKELYSLLKRLRAEEKKTVIAVMHDITEAVQTADNIVFLDGGRLLFFGTAEACIRSGLIEKVFKVKKYEYETEDGKRILYK